MRSVEAKQRRESAHKIKRKVCNPNLFIIYLLLFLAVFSLISEFFFVSMFSFLCLCRGNV